MSRNRACFCLAMTMAVSVVRLSIGLLREHLELLCPMFTQVCIHLLQEMEQGVVKMVIPTPNGTNKIGFNTDRYVFDPTCNSPKDIRHLKFLGLIFGVAIRTRKPLNLHLARPMWKLLTGMTITPDDLEEVCVCVCVCGERERMSEE